MARNDSKQNDQATPRVYKASAVHKRRAGQKAPAADSARVDSSALAVDEPAPVDQGGASPLVHPDKEQATQSESIDQKESSLPVYSETLEEPVDQEEIPLPVRPDALEEEPPAAIADEADNSESPVAVADEAENNELPDVATDEADSKPPESSKTRQRKKVRPRTVVLAIVAIIVVAVVAAVSLFAWNRWGRYNDSEDFKGTWYVQGTAVPVTIDDSLIHLADDVAYSYAIDERDKTISYTFGDWRGQGRYRFNDDRSELVITDGSEFTGVGNTADDFARMLEELKPGGASPEEGQAQEDGSITLSRTAPTGALVARLVNDRIDQEKAAQEALDEEMYGYYY